MASVPDTVHVPDSMTLKKKRRQKVSTCLFYLFYVYNDSMTLKKKRRQKAKANLNPNFILLSDSMTLKKKRRQKVTLSKAVPIFVPYDSMTLKKKRRQKAIFSSQFFIPFSLRFNDSEKEEKTESEIPSFGLKLL